MLEIPKRLSPKNEVTRELYLKSGNICAFPGCHNLLTDENGNFIGQICHIEAAEEGGERFNPNMTNEERRSYDNLILMCYEHHIVTNNVESYTVDKLKKIKKDHEDKYSGIIQRIQNSVVDYGKVTLYKTSTMCTLLSETLDFRCSDKENMHNSSILNELLDKLIDLPIETRKLFSIMVDRSFLNDTKSASIIPLHEIGAATGKDSVYILQHVDILSRRNLISDIYYDDYNRPFTTLYIHKETGWDYWTDIRDFCKMQKLPLDEVIVNANFSIFD